MRDDDGLDREPDRVERDRGGGGPNSRVALARERDRLRVRSAFVISGVWGAAYFGFPSRPVPPELSAAFFAAVAYLLGTRTPED